MDRTPMFERLAIERPPSERACFVHDPATGRTLLVVHGDEGVDVWQRDDRCWRPHARGLLAGFHSLLPPIAWAASDGTATIGVVTRDGVETTTLAGQRASYAGDAGAYTGHAAAVWFERAYISTGHNIYVLDDDRLVPYAKGPIVTMIAAEPTRIVGAGLDELYELSGRDWRPLVTARNLQGLAWHPTLRAVVTLRSDGDDRMRLYALRDRSLEPLDIVAPCYRNGVSLHVTPDARVLVFGGQDFTDASGDHTNETLASEPGGHELVADPAPPALGRYTTAITTATRLVVVNHSSARELGGTPLSAAHGDPDAPALDDRFLQFAANDDELFMLDARGALWAARTGEPYRRIAPHSPGPGGHYSHRTAFAWDPPSRRLVVFGGSESNATWVCDPTRGAFVELRPSHPPPHGIGSIVGTPKGAYLLVDRELYRFVDDRWDCVGAGVDGTHLLFDRRRERLLVGGGNRLGTLELPVTGRPFAGHGSCVGVDPATDRLVVLGERETFALSLDAIGGTPGLPTTPIEPPTRRLAEPPPAWTRRAARLRLGAPTSTPWLEVDGELVAIVPAGERAVAISDDGGDYHARIVAAHPPVVIVDGCSYLLELEPYDELDPDHIFEVDTPPASPDPHGSKIGGFPRFIQDDPIAGDVFVAQLCGDLHESGDWGAVYVWIRGDTAHVVAQSH